MGRFIYTAWFRDSNVHLSDQDHEWVACILIVAETSEGALNWGDYLAEQRSRRFPHSIFLRSSIEVTDPAEVPPNNLPIVRDKEVATDDEIGW